MLFCGVVVLHINDHLKTHKTQQLVEQAVENDDFTALRKMGDDRHNSACIEKGGEIIIARRPTEKQFDISTTDHVYCADNGCV